MASMTIVTLVDDDGDEFPITLPGVYENNGNHGPDIEAAFDIAKEYIANGSFTPKGELSFSSIEFKQ